MLGVLIIASDSIAASVKNFTSCFIVASDSIVAIIPIIASVPIVASV